MSDKIKKLTGTEYGILSERFNLYCDSEETMHKHIADCGQEVDKTLDSIGEGVDRFYALYQSGMSSEDIQKQLEKKMEDMDKRQQYSYLANLLTAMTHICGRSLKDKNWEQMETDHESILYAIDEGLLDLDTETVQNDIDEMKDMVIEQIQQASILIVQDSRYEEIQQACMDQDLNQVKALAVNTREAAVNMAAALYTLHKEGKLESLGEGEIPPEDMGVMAASALEIDAAAKDAAVSGSWSMAKDIITKASQAATTLLVSSPVLVEGVLFVGFVGLLANFSTAVLLIGGAVTFINIKMRMNQVKEQLQPVFKVGARIVDTTLDKVQDVYLNIKAWTDTNVVPRVVMLWKRCSSFAMDRIIIPAAKWLIKAKDITEKRVSAIYEKACDAARRIMNDINGSSRDNESEVMEKVDLEEEDVVEDNDDVVI